MLIATVLLVVLWGVKLLAIGRAVRWVAKNGKAYSQRLQERIAKAPSIPPSQHFYQTLDTFPDAQFFPFGLNDYLLRRCAETCQRRLQKWLAIIIAKGVFRGTYLAVFTSVWVLLTTMFGLFRDVREVESSWHWWLFFVLALCPLAGVAELCVEFITAYVKMGSYAWAFHMNQESENRLYDEMLLVVVLFGRMVLASGTATYVVALCTHGFAGKALVCARPGDPLQCLGLFCQSVYFAVTTVATVGYGDIAPSNAWAQFVAFCTIVVSFSAVVFLFAALSSINSNRGTEKLPEQPPA